MVHPGYRKRTIFLLIALLLVRFWFGQTFELSGQEAYLWLQGHGTNLSPAYWERGPLVPLLIRIGTAFFGDTELGVRWLAAVICCTSGFILFYLARHWFDARAAFWTVVLFIVLPIYAWKFSFMTEAAASTGLMALAMMAFSLAIENGRARWWLMGGAVCGLALLIALANAWWVVGLVIYFASNPARRVRLREGWLWGAILFACLFLLPLIWWWHGPQVADVAHTRIISSWPLSHGFSLNQGFHFIGLEIFYLCPLFFILLLFVIGRLGQQLWVDPRFSLLIWLALPGLIWQNFAAFFHEGHFELVPALFLPLILLAGCYMAGLTAINRVAEWTAAAILIVAAAQSLAGLNPFYFDSRGHLSRTLSGENATSFYASKRQVSWRNLADAVQGLQRDEGVGATLIITDTPETASALSFYLPHNPFVYVESKDKIITHFDFWPGYAQSASPNDSALYLSHSTSPDRPADPPSADIYKNFASVTPIEDPPLPDFDKAWDIWNCQNFIGSGGQTAGDAQATPMRDSDALPK
jgi:4-amino-4-deoxy-L-arabinose transferase-like glycosyltransferase